MSDVKEEVKTAPLASMSGKQLVGAAAVGLMIGLIVWGMGSIVDQYVFQVIFCQDTQSGNCHEATSYAQAIGAIIGAGLGLFGLVKLRVLRPLLVVVAGMIALWNFPTMIGMLPIYGVIIATALLYAGLYALFAWLARLRSIYAVIALFTVIIILIRLAITA